MHSKHRGYDGRYRRDGTPRTLPQQLPENPDNKLYIGNLHRSIGEVHIVKLFSKFGELVRVHFLWHKAGELRGLPRGFCFVEFSTKEEAEAAKQKLAGRLLKGRKLIIEWYRNRPEDVDLEEWPMTEAKQRMLRKEAELERRNTIRDIKDKLDMMKDGVQERRIKPTSDAPATTADASGTTDKPTKSTSAYPARKGPHTVGAKRGAHPHHDGFRTHKKQRDWGATRDTATRPKYIRKDRPT